MVPVRLLGNRGSSSTPSFNHRRSSIHTRIDRDPHTTSIVSLVCAAQDTLPDEFPSSTKERKGTYHQSEKKER